MREIKFRAWDKKHKRWVYFTIKDLWFLNEGKEYYQEQWCDFECWCEFTNLLDRNGKEIYSDDILRGKKSEQNGSNEYEIKDKVYSSLGGFTLFGKPMQEFTWQDDYKIKNIMWVSIGHLNIPNIYYQIIDIEIIGNTMENPELLKEVK